MSSERPKCWGRDFQSEDRECKGCSWQVSCRERVMKEAIDRQRAEVQPFGAPTMTNYYQPQPQTFQPAPQYAMPQQVPPSTYYQPAPLARQIPVQAPAPAPYTVQVQQQQQPMYAPVPYRPPAQAVPAPPAVQAMSPIPQHQMLVMDYYGRFQDPLLYPLTMAVPPPRPQLPGESFAERLIKNMALSMGEAFLVNLILGVRQLVWAPPAPRHAFSPGETHTVEK